MKKSGRRQFGGRPAGIHTLFPFAGVLGLVPRTDLLFGRTLGGHHGGD